MTEIEMHNDLLMRALRGEETERRPLWIMRQAGRYLPEYRALRAQNTFEELCASPELSAEVTMQPIERFPLDAAIVFADLMSPVAALGIDVRFDPGPVIDRPLKDAAAIRALRVPEAPSIAPEVPETLKLVKARLAGRASLIGFAGAPLSIAAYLVQGRGGKDFAPLRALMFQDPVLFGELLDTLAQLSARFLIEQHKAGADVVQVFDSWAGIVCERDWQTHVRPHVERLLTELGNASVPRIMFQNGAPHLSIPACELPSEGLAVCWRSDLAALRAHVGPPSGSNRASGSDRASGSNLGWKALQGNLDPACLLAGPEAAARATRALLERMPARGHIVNLGHGIMPDAPIESVEAVIAAVHAEASVAERSSG